VSLRKKMMDLKREFVLEEAGKLFNQDGYEEMKIAELAKQVGVSIGTIYTLFGSKENLYHNYIISQIEHYGGILETELQQCSTSRERIQKIIEIQYQGLSKNTNALRQSVINDPTFFIYAIDDKHPLVQVLELIAKEVMEPLIKESGAKKTPMELTFLLDGLILGSVNYTIVCGGNLIDKVEETVENFMTLLKAYQ
jgi:AcrR family transcriptional regulator